MERTVVAAQEELAAFAVRIYLEDRGVSQALADTCSERQVEEAFPSCQDELLGLFSPEDTGGDIELVPATQADMRGGTYEPKPSLEVIYDEV